MGEVSDKILLIKNMLDKVRAWKNLNTKPNTLNPEIRALSDLQGPFLTSDEVTGIIYLLRA